MELVESVHFDGVHILQLENSNPTLEQLHSGVLEWSCSVVEGSHIKHVLFPSLIVFQLVLILFSPPLFCYI
jgi:hypothetical protein